MSDFFTLKWQDRQLIVLDQTLLPGRIEYRTLETVSQVHDAIRNMSVRGAPAIGVAAGYGMVLAALAVQAAVEAEYEGDHAVFIRRLELSGEFLAKARPTAVNLQWAIERMLDCARSLASDGTAIARICALLEQEAIAIHEEDLLINRSIGENLLGLLKDGDTILTHCNAGSLATAGYGTALSVFYLAQEKGIRLKAYADETRPRLQGARLTAFELYQAGIDVTLICDNMAAVVMAEGKINAVIVGCDRIAANGDTANKIGTFSLSILARHFGIPLYIAAPTPTIDLNCPTGKDIPIELRSDDEVLVINGEPIAPKGVTVYNPAFDITPAENITAIVTERGIVYPPFGENLRSVCGPGAKTDRKQVER